MLSLTEVILIARATRAGSPGPRFPSLRHFNGFGTAANINAPTACHARRGFEQGEY
jgi:hypothetical protein